MDGESPADAQKRHRAALADHKPPPSMDWITGNGVCALWRVEPVKLNTEADIESCKAINVEIIRALGGKAKGADNCQSLDHLLRLPFTPNLPDARKRAKGRKREMAGDLRSNDRRYDVFDFPVDATDASLAPDAAIGDADPCDVEALPAALQKAVNKQVAEGKRSDHVFGVICNLIREGISDEQILWLLTNEDYAISERILERKGGAETFARSEIKRAHKKMRTAADDFSNEEIDGEEQSDGSWLPQWDRHWSKLKSWQWIADSSQFIHDDGIQMYNDKQFERMFGKLYTKKLMTGVDRGDVPMKKFSGQVFIPNAPTVMKHNGRTVFNLWREFGLKPNDEAMAAGEHQWFLDHVHKLFPDLLQRNLLLDFMAHLIQHPEVKIHFAILLVSEEGVGKGALGVLLRRMIGERNAVEPAASEVIDHAFTAWMEGAQLAIINELMVSGADIYNNLKSPITDKTLRIKKKFLTPFEIPNHLNFFCMSNFMNAVPIKKRDRRWMILQSKMDPEADAYYNSLFANINNDRKCAAVMAYLLKRKIAINPKGVAPWTPAKGDMLDRVKSDVETDLQTMFEEARGVMAHQLLRLEDVADVIRANHRNEKGVYNQAAEFMDRIGAVKLKRYKKGDHGLPAHQLYAVRNQKHWQKADPIESARAYAAQNKEFEDAEGDNPD